jgi:hypothetical protein
LTGDFGDRAVNGYSMALMSLLREVIKMKAAQDEGKKVVNRILLSHNFSP